MYKVYKRCGQPVIEIYESEDIKITKYPCTGYMEIEFKPNCNPKIKEMYKQLYSDYCQERAKCKK
jgi:hypothetical protein